MTFSARAELAGLARFLAAPRRTPRPLPAGALTHWVRRALFFAALALALNVVLEYGLLAPLAASARIGSDLPEVVTGSWVLLAVGFAPVFEELVFRAGLRRAGYTLFVGPVLIALIVVPGREQALAVGGGLALVALGVYLLWRHVVFRRAGARFAAGRRFVAHYRWIFWAYAVAFALVHVGNYAFGGPGGGWVMLLVAPQFVVGSVAGYLRLRDGLRASVLLHFAGNAAAVAGLLMWR